MMTYKHGVVICYRTVVHVWLGYKKNFDNVFYRNMVIYRYITIMLLSRKERIKKNYYVVI